MSNQYYTVRFNKDGSGKVKNGSFDVPGKNPTVLGEFIKSIMPVDQRDNYHLCKPKVAGIKRVPERLMQHESEFRAAMNLEESYAALAKKYQRSA
ncbi:hypothetical protein GF367_02555 [Candidatus Woesearchaeota archaeon]|nr:hypothetical protein [Candidatus Woesearchaeota archaeon]